MVMRHTGPTFQLALRANTHQSEIEDKAVRFIRTFEARCQKYRFWKS